MKNHVFLAVLLCALSAPCAADAGEWQDQKDNWRAKWQEHQGSNKAAAVAAAAGELKDKYGHLSPQEAKALRERVKQAKDKYFSPEERAERWEAFKAKHPDVVADMKGEDGERRKQWEEWQEKGGDASEAWSEKSRAARDKWQEFKRSQDGSSMYEQRQNWKDFKFQNRDEAMEAKRKYEAWKENHSGTADSLKAKAQEWKARQ